MYRKNVPLGTGTEFQVPITVPVPVQMWTVPNPRVNANNFYLGGNIPLNHSTFINETPLPETIKVTLHF